MLSSPIACLLTRPIDLSLGGRVHKLLATHRVLLEFEAVAKLSTLTEFSVAKLTTKQLVQLLQCSIQFSPARTGREAEWLANRLSRAVSSLPKLREVRKALILAWDESMPTVEQLREVVPEQEDKKPKPKSRSKVQLSWPRLWSIARYNLGLSSDEWLDLTPRLLFELEHRHLESMQQAEMIGAIVAHTVAHFSYSPPKTKIPFEHFMLHPPHKTGAGAEAEVSEEEMSGDEVMEAMMKFNKDLREQKTMHGLACAKPMYPAH